MKEYCAWLTPGPPGNFGLCVGMGRVLWICESIQPSACPRPDEDHRAQGQLVSWPGHRVDFLVQSMGAIFKLSLPGCLHVEVLVHESSRRTRVYGMKLTYTFQAEHGST